MPFRLGRLVISWQQPESESRPEPTDTVESVASSVLDSTYDSEAAGRKLAAQLGDTITSGARISSRALRMRARGEQMLQQVDGGAASIEELSASMDHLTSQIERQAGLVDQSAAAIEQMTASIESVAQVAGVKRSAAQALRDLTATGSHNVVTAETAISDVSNQVESVNRMIDVINTIAARTNLLAMNAAIEAAHAGSAGRGFAVVADEIRSLATSTAKNATEIASLLKQLVKRIAEAREASGGTRDAFTQIETGAGDVALAFEEITASTAELAAGAREIVSATGELHSISDETRGSAAEMRIGARELTGVVIGSREAAQDSVELMGQIVSAAKDVNIASNRITGNSIESNSRVSALIARLGSFVADDAERVTEADDARQRLGISSLILQHLAWVGKARALIDGSQEITADEMVDEERCELGVWLATEGKTVITSPETYRRLKQRHHELHEALRVIVGCDTETASGCVDVEDTFEELLDASHDIVEVLTTYQSGESLKWGPRVAVNVSVFDEHHKKLFQLINNLYDSVRAGTAGAALVKVFDELLAYTDWHFGAEQAALRHFDYPQCDHHFGQHKALIAKVKELRTELQAGRAMVTTDVMEFLRDWVSNHIRGCDRLYGEFFRDKDVEEFVSHHVAKATPTRTATVPAV